MDDVLHSHRHTKTATTSIQHSFNASKEEIEKTSFRWIGAHQFAHQFAESFLKTAKISNSDEYFIKKRTKKYRDHIAEEVNAAPVEKFLFSSEYLYFFSLEEIRVFRKVLEDIVPENHEFRIICYVRDPIDFATSDCQEGAKSGKGNLAAFFENPWRHSQSEIIRNYRSVFGETMVDVRYFNKNALIDGDIFSDFLDAVDVDSQSFPLKRLFRNASLTHEGVYVADALRQIRPHQERTVKTRRMYKAALQSIEGRKFILPEAVQKLVIEKSKSDIEQINEWYGLGIKVRDVVPAPLESEQKQDAMKMAAEIDQRIHESTK